jgi:hypothetical protein
VNELSPRLRRVIVAGLVLWAVVVVGYVVLGLLALGHRGVHVL